MAVAFRFAIRKLGRTGLCAQSYARVAANNTAWLSIYSSRPLLDFQGHHRNKPLPLQPVISEQSNFYSGNDDEFSVPSPVGESMDHPRITALAHFALTEYDKRKVSGHQLRLGRVVRASDQRLGAALYYFLTLEVEAEPDDDHDRVYQALVKKSCGETKLELFGRVKNVDGSLSILIFKRPRTPDDGPERQPDEID